MLKIDGKTDTIHPALSNEIEICGGVESLSGFGSDEVSVINGIKKVASKSKSDYLKIISIHYHSYALALAILPFIKESIFLMKSNNYLIC